MVRGYCRFLIRNLSERDQNVFDLPCQKMIFHVKPIRVDNNLELNVENLGFMNHQTLEVYPCWFKQEMSFTYKINDPGSTIPFSSIRGICNGEILSWSSHKWLEAVKTESKKLD